MKLSEAWLREWVNPSENTEKLIDQITMAGLEVDACEPVAGHFSGVIVAEIMAAEKHPNADRLRLCQVKIGDNAVLSIVCGAANARAGIKVALAQIDAKLPGDFVIKRSKIRGVESEGMLCSAKELGLAEESEGIIELPEDAPLGVDLRAYMQLDDHIWDVDFTPNRGDCLSVMGLARDVAALTNNPLKPFAFPVQATTIAEQFPISITASEACPLYCGRIIRNININIETPFWLAEKLRRSGLRSINPIVDVTNYVMLELGQPLHAFDLAQLEQQIEVRMANLGEKITLLNDQTIELQTNTLVIADANKPVAIAGIMGGANSSVNDTTKNIFLESAFFTPNQIAGRARQYGLHTDSSFRFERGVDPQLALKAMERATELLLLIVGGEVAPVIEVRSDNFLPKEIIIRVAKQKITRYLGITIPEAEIIAILQRLNFSVTDEQEYLSVKIPSYRFDMSRDVDVIEEIIRIYGYQNIPSHAPMSPLDSQQPSETKIQWDILRQTLVQRGYQEAITYSFVEPKIQQLLEPDTTPLALLNPISSDLAVMRTSLWSGLLNTVLHNQHRQEQRVRLFEIGQRFRTVAGELQQEYVISGIASGSRFPEQWGQTSAAIDFFDIKSDISALLSLTRKDKDFIFSAAEHTALFPGQTAEIRYNGEHVGFVGAIHPKIEKALDCVGPIFLFELKLSSIDTIDLPKYSPVSKFPAIRRDIAVLVDKSVTAEAIKKLVMAVGGELLTNVLIFDVYSGKNIAQNQKSLALGLTLQDSSRTLVDVEINEIVANIVTALKQEFDATLRE